MTIPSEGLSPLNEGQKFLLRPNNLPHLRRIHIDVVEEEISPVFCSAWLAASYMHKENGPSNGNLDEVPHLVHIPISSLPKSVATSAALLSQT